jgi:two-component system, LytTR family, sensor kinase
MHLDMKRRCEQCASALAPDDEAYICSFECTFCSSCASNLHNVCPNCGGELVRRPRRKTILPEVESSEPRTLGQKAWVIWASSFGLWIFIAIARGVSLYQFDRSLDPHATLAREVTIPLINYLIYACLTPILVYIGLRYPIQRFNWGRRSTLYFVGGFAFAAAHVLARVVVYPINLGNADQPAKVSWFLLKSLFFYNVANDVLFVYLPVLMVAHLLWYYHRFTDRELRTSQLETQLTKATLHALKSQLQPHFLFNTLHSISALMLTDVRSADAMITRLSDLLRMSLADSGVQVTTLSHELEFVTAYLEIENIRFEDRLRVVFDVAPDTLDAQVPHLLLQPLVENAVRHGVSRMSSGGMILIAASQHSGHLDLRVKDNGPGFAESAGHETNGGLGLKLVRERLRRLYGPAHAMEVRQVPEGGVEVGITIPFRVDSGRPVTKVITATST